MPLAYREPGVNVDEVVTPQISPILASPALVAIVGLAQGFATRTDQFVLSGTAATPLPGLPVGATVQSFLFVRDTLNPSKGAADGSGYTVTADYTASTVAGTITRVGAGAIADGTLINVTYTYLVGDYFAPMRLYDMGTVENRYGPALNPTGTAINSQLSYAASVAFENGAGSIVCQPLFVRAVPGDPTSATTQPNATQAAAVSTWQDTLYILRDLEDINVLIPIVGQSMPNVGDATLLSLFQVVQDHCYFMARQNQYIVSLLGEDASASNTVAQKATLQSHAATLRGRYAGVMAEQTVLISPAKYARSLPTFGQQLTIGGQFAAAAVGGMLASRPVSASLTRKVVSGITRVTDPRDLQEKNADAGAGLMIIEERRGSVLVRHSITLDQTSAARRELSVVRAKHRMIESVKETIDRQIVGNIIADENSPMIVRSTVAGVLERLRQARDLVDYTGVQARLLSLDPTTIQVRFSYRPSFPLNYVDIQFSIDMTAGTTIVADQTLTFT